MYLVITGVPQSEIEADNNLFTFLTPNDHFDDDSNHLDKGSYYICVC